MKKDQLFTNMEDKQLHTHIMELLESNWYQDCTIKHQAFMLIDLLKWCNK